MELGNVFTTSEVAVRARPSVSIRVHPWPLTAHHALSLAAGATFDGAASVDVYRDGNLIASGVTANPYTDNIGNKGGGSYTYQVCETGGGACSNTVNVVF